MTVEHPRRRPSTYAPLLGLTIVLGLLSRSPLVPEDTLVRDLAGDVLWAIAVYWSLALVLPKWGPRRLALASLLTSFAVELSQLYHASWIEAIRGTRMGGLLLGFTFHWPDLLCYAAGVGVAALIDHYLTNVG